MKNKIIIIFLLIIPLLYGITNCPAQEVTDSLILALMKSQEDTNKVNILNDLSETNLASDPDKAMDYANKALLLGKDLNYKHGIATSYSNIGNAYDIKGIYEKAIVSINKAIEINEELKDIAAISDNEKDLGRIYQKQGNYNDAITCYLSSLKKKEELGDEKGIASNLNNVGMIYYFQHYYDKAKEYFERTLVLVKEQGNKNAVAITLNNIGNIYYAIEDNEKAMEYFQSSLKIKQEIGNKFSIAKSLNNIGNIYKSQQDYAKAIEYYHNALAITEEIGDKWGSAGSYMNLGVVYQAQKQYSSAIKYLEKAIEIASEIGYKEGLKISHQVISEVYSQTGDFEKAYENFTYYSDYKDTILNEENSKFISELQEKYEADKREKELALSNAELQKRNLTIKAQNTLIYGVVAGLILAITLIFFVLRSYRQKKRANELLAAQNEEISQQKEVIEAKNQDIMASIKYAKRIQEAILPPPKLVRESLENSFILYKPKDIVSGDFYWMENKKDMIFFSAVDCTGHGVPGAFMSIVGYNGLNQAVNEKGLTKPGEILDHLNHAVEASLHQTTDKADVKDGMDIALCTISLQDNVVEFAGANNPLYIITNKDTELKLNGSVLKPSIEGEKRDLYEIKGDKQPIGAYEDKRNFTNNSFSLSPGDAIYVFSDGFADQFGGPKNKKFKYKPFKKLLLEIEEKPVLEQKDILNKKFEEWRGKMEQVDDVCIIGVKL